jgi:hypothetical protein
MDIGHVERIRVTASTVELMLLDRPPTSRGRAVLDRGVTPAPAILGRVAVTYRTDDLTDPAIVGVALNLESETVTADMLRRLPWAKVLTAAAANRRTTGDNSIEAHRDATLRTDAITDRPQSARPRGRPAMAPGKLAAVARRYEELQQAGNSAPNKTISAEYGVPRNTVSGWIHKARKRGLLPPTEQGKPN